VARSNLTKLSSRRPFTIIGIVLALLVIAAFVLVAFNAGTGSVGQQMNVVVASSDLLPRIPIDAAALELKNVPVAGTPSQALYFHKISDVKGMIPLVTIVSGQAITSNLIAKPGSTLGAQSEFLPIPSGYVALTLPTSEQQGVGGYIQPDDYISVIATVAVGTKVASKTIFTNLHVIRVGPLQPASASTPNSGPASSLTVVVTECQAEIITWFLTYAALKYALESYQDYLQAGGQAKDPGCPTVDSAKGVTLQSVQAAYPTLF
jgi:Flp pilus assembly protein CpaB